jgi:hypothetical protein
MLTQAHLVLTRRRMRSGSSYRGPRLPCNSRGRHQPKSAPNHNNNSLVCCPVHALHFNTNLIQLPLLLFRHATNAPNHPTQQPLQRCTLATHYCLSQRSSRNRSRSLLFPLLLAFHSRSSRTRPIPHNLETTTVPPLQRTVFGRPTHPDR